VGADVPDAPSGPPGTVGPTRTADGEVAS
jgi:hypothetical protein